MSQVPASAGRGAWSALWNECMFSHPASGCPHHKAGPSSCSPVQPHLCKPPHQWPRVAQSRTESRLILNILGNAIEYPVLAHIIGSADTMVRPRLHWVFYTSLLDTDVTVFYSSPHITLLHLHTPAIPARRPGRGQGQGQRQGEGELPALPWLFGLFLPWPPGTWCGVQPPGETQMFAGGSGVS